MRLEILIDSEEPFIYPLNKPEIVIGAGDACDIILGSAGISRKHVKVVVEKESFFVIDQGSTNGTFINEERLVPGRRTEFTSFFPVRLGARVLLTLLSDEEAQDSILKEFSVQATKSDIGNESTRILSLKDVQAASTKKLVSNRQATIVKKKNSSSTGAKKKKVVEDSSRMRNTFVFALIICTAAYFYKFHTNQNLSSQSETDLKGTSVQDPLASTKILNLDKPEVSVKVAPTVENLKINSEELISREKITSLFSDLKCLIPEELFFCDKLPSLTKGNGGVASVGNSLVFLIEQTAWFASSENAKIMYLKNLSGGGATLPESELDSGVQKLAFFDFLKTQILPLDLKDYSDKDFYIVFYKEGEQPLSITRVFAIKTKAIPELLKNFTMDRLLKFHQYGPSVLTEFETFYQVF